MGRLRKLIPRFSLRTLALFLLLVTSGFGLWWHWEAWYCERVLKGHTHSVKSVCFFPDGERLVTVGDMSGRIWDVRSGRCLKVLEHPGWAKYVDVSPDGSLVATGDYVKGTVRIWDARTGDLKADMDGHKGKLRGLRFSRDGRIVISASKDKTARFHDSGDGHLIGATDEYWRYSASSDESPDGTRYACGAYEICIRDISTGETLLKWRGHGRYIRCLRFSPDGRSLASSSVRDTTVCIWNAASGNRLRALAGHTDYAWSLAFSPDGLRLVSAGHEVRVWDVESGGCVAELAGGGISEDLLAFSPNAMRFAVAGGPEFSALVYRRRRPEWWWGVFWLWEFWLTVAFAGVFVWSAVRDRRALGTAVPSPLEGEG